MTTLNSLLLKSGMFTFFLIFSFYVFSQTTTSMEEVEMRKEISMAEANGKTEGGVYRYYAKGEEEPFTGILFAKYDNGNYSSWQEYVNGVGQGKWINYYENGNFKEVGNYNQNLVEGPIKKYYPNGAIKAEGTYKDWRVRVGTWKYYDRDGNLESTQHYGTKGSIEEVKEYYQRGDISYKWYSEILKKNGFTL